MGSPLRWRHNGRDSVPAHQPHDCLLNRLFRRISKKTSKLRVTGLCAGNLPGTGRCFHLMTSSWNSLQNNPAMLICLFIFCNIYMNKWWNFVSDELIYGRKMLCFVWKALRSVICECHVMAFKHDDVIKWKHFHVTGPLWGESTGQRQVTQSFYVFFDMCPNKRLRKLPRRRWFDTPSRSLWRSCNESPATRNRLTTTRISKLHITDPLLDSPHIDLVTQKALRRHDTFMWHIFNCYFLCYLLLSNKRNRVIVLTSQWVRWRLKSPGSRLFAQLFVQAQIKKKKKTSKLRATGLYEGSPLVTGEFPSQTASNDEMFPLGDVIMLSVQKKIMEKGKTCRCNPCFLYNKSGNWVDATEYS